MKKTNIQIFREKEEKYRYNLFCPLCKKEIKGISRQHCISNFRFHFQIIHPEYEFGKFLFEEV